MGRIAESVLAAEIALVGGGSEEDDAKVRLDTPREKEFLVRSDAMSSMAACAGRLAHGRKTVVGDGWCSFNTHAMQQILLSVSGLEFLL